MSYEFTERKVKAERKALWRGIAISVAACAAGAGVGGVMSDLETISGVLRAATFGFVAGTLGFAFAALLHRRSRDK